ncbi:unnamed protein product [Paramecium sonneborni]|uniref:Transmembrane protein n=1 Tax=Paramecium sonneborni TaxID=65129 RepID=A0A8S1LWS2_9CILI|nr:unnamed protein product [Paramecium sonneborni]
MSIIDLKLSQRPEIILIKIQQLISEKYVYQEINLIIVRTEIPSLNILVNKFLLIFYIQLFTILIQLSLRLANLQDQQKLLLSQNIILIILLSQNTIQLTKNRQDQQKVISYSLFLFSLFCQLDQAYCLIIENIIVRRFNSQFRITDSKAINFQVFKMINCS